MLEGEGVNPLSDPVRSSATPKCEEFEEEEVEVMELADPSGYLSSGNPLVFTIPAAAAETPLKKGPLNRKKSFNWLAYPNRMMNKLKQSSNWSAHYGGRNKGSRDSHTSPPPNKGIGGRKECDEDGWETVSEDSEDEDGEWEETFLYLELDDLPSVQELFAVKPDDFLRFQHRRVRHKAQPVKPTYPKLNFAFHQLESQEPIVQIGRRYFAGSWEEPTGSALFFKKKVAASMKPEPQAGSSKSPESPQRVPSSLSNIVPEASIRCDPIFGSSNLSDSYEMVAMADKVLKTKSFESGHAPMYKIPRSNRQFLGRLPAFKIPRGYTLRDLLAGTYEPQEGKKLRRKKGTKRNSEGKKVVQEARGGEGDQELLDVQNISNQASYLTLLDQTNKGRENSNI